MKDKDLFRKRLFNIMMQFTSDQREELMEMLHEEPKFQPAGYPYNYIPKMLNELSDEEVKYLHDKFITRQYSEDPSLQGEDIRGVIIYPYKSE